MVAWCKLFAFVAVEKLFGFWFFWQYFPSVVNARGKVGVLELFAGIWSISVLMWWGYDCLGRDLTGIESIKKKFAETAFRRVRLRRISAAALEILIGFWIFGELHHPASESFGAFGTASLLAGITAVAILLWFIPKVIVELLVLAIQFIPPFVILFLRKEGRKGDPMTEFAIIGFSSALATAWWTLYSLGFLSVSNQSSPLKLLEHLWLKVFQ